MPTVFEHITSSDLLALPRESTVFFFPIGVLEDHGPHLPMSLDVAEAESLCFVAAERLERDQSEWHGVVMPRASMGVQGNTTRVSLGVRGHVVRDLLVDSCLALTRLGFRHFACVSGTLSPRQLTAIEEAGLLLAKRTRRGLRKIIPLIPTPKDQPTLISVSSAMIERETVIASPLWPDPKEHGGRRDTSVALSIVPELVKAGASELKNLDRPASRMQRLKLYRSRKREGYWGTPEGASGEEGQSLLKDRLFDVYPKMRAVWQGAAARKIFRSGYSVFPPNGSFFNAWVLALLLGVLLMIWSLLTFQALISWV